MWCDEDLLLLPQSSPHVYTLASTLGTNSEVFPGLDFHQLSSTHLVVILITVLSFPPLCPYHTMLYRPLLHYSIYTNVYTQWHLTGLQITQGETGTGGVRGYRKCSLLLESSTVFTPGGLIQTTLAHRRTRSSLDTTAEA